ncbi:hypothetical protein [Streptomyces phaeofaciens]|uniref:hypothetical protein n=1 Tax=Streptomyces phaeofaciens TaxID=68254 RepID=UPI0036B6AE30
MSTGSGGVLRLPAAAIPEGCRPWDGEHARQWTRALPPRWVPVRAQAWLFLGLPLVAVGGAGLLGESTGLPAWGAALVALPVVWAVLRPEAARILAPVAVVVVLVLGGVPWALRLGLAAALTVLWALALLRLAALGPQREAALAAAGGVTVPLPEAAGGRPERGTFLFGSGLLVAVAGGAVYATAGLWDAPGDRQAAPAAGWCLAGLGLTVLLTAALARHRAAGLRGAPVPVLRVLMRENTDVDTEVYAADDVTAQRPLFTVATRELDEDGDDGDDDGDDEDTAEDADEDQDLNDLLDRIDEERTGPLREAVLYGVPHDGAEVVFLAAAEEDGEPPVVEVGVGSVRPVTEWTLRRRDGRRRSGAVREARYEERRLAAVDRVRDEAAAGVVKIRRWRAGWPDWLAVLVALAYAAHFWEDTGWWRYFFGFGLTLLAALLLPRRLAWRVTADSEGLWFNGFRQVRQLPWDQIRVVRTSGAELKVDGKRASFQEWTVHTPRWPWLERRLGVVHPYERTAAEITAMWRNPELRPVGVSDARQRGRAVWPLGVVIGVVGAATVLLLP